METPEEISREFTAEESRESFIQNSKKRMLVTFDFRLELVSTDVPLQLAHYTELFELLKEKVWRAEITQDHAELELIFISISPVDFSVSGKIVLRDLGIHVHIISGDKDLGSPDYFDYLLSDVTQESLKLKNCIYKYVDCGYVFQRVYLTDEQWNNDPHWLDYLSEVESEPEPEQEEEVPYGGFTSEQEFEEYMETEPWLDDYDRDR